MSRKLDYSIDFNGGFVQVFDSTSRILLEEIEFRIIDGRLHSVVEIPSEALALLVSGYDRWLKRREFSRQNAGFLQTLQHDLDDSASRNFNAFDGTKGS